MLPSGANTRMSGSTWLTTTTERSSSSSASTIRNIWYSGGPSCMPRRKLGRGGRSNSGMSPRFSTISTPALSLTTKSCARAPDDASQARHRTAAARIVILRKLSIRPSRSSYGIRVKRTRAARHTSSESRVVP